MPILRHLRLVLASFGLWAGVASAAPIVIYDSGATQSLAPFLEVFEETPAEAPRLTQPARQLGAADLSRLLPIRTPELTPGPVKRRPLQLPNGATLSRPFFLVGADTQSRQWLAAHRDRLEAIGAVGMLVEAESESDLEAIAEIGRGLPIMPAPATDIARSLGLDHIPVLISRRGIEQ